MAEILNSCGKITRIAFILFNIFLGAVGVGIIGFGSYIVHVAQIDGSIFIVLVIGDIFIVAGIILVILVVVGIIGAALSSKIVLCQYIFFVIAVTLLLVVGGILGFVYIGKIASILGNHFNYALDNYRDSSDPQYKPHINTMIDFLQSKAKCCGWNDAMSDWNRTPYYMTNNRFPNSCTCTRPGPSCRSTITSTEQLIWNRVCNESAVRIAKVILVIIGGIGFGVALILILPIAMSVYLITLLASRRHEYENLNPV